MQHCQVVYMQKAVAQEYAWAQRSARSGGQSCFNTASFLLLYLFCVFFFFFVPSSLVPSRERKLFDVHVNNGYQGKTSVAGARPGWARVGLKGLAGIGA